MATSLGTSKTLLNSSNGKFIIPFGIFSVDEFLSAGFLYAEKAALISLLSANLFCLEIWLNKMWLFALLKADLARDFGFI